MPDTPGWATDTIASALIRHLDGFDFIRRYSNQGRLTLEDENFGLVYIMLLRPALRLLEQFEAEHGRPFNAPVCTGIHGMRGVEVPGLADELGRFKAVNVVNGELHGIVKKIHGRVHLTPSGVDADRFRPGAFEDSFRVVWAGNPSHHWKRAWLLNLLRYRVERSDGHLDAEMMPAFYRGAGALVIVSRDEGGPLTALEAAASGVPVVSTRVGIVPSLVDGEWIVDDGLYWKMTGMEIAEAFNELLEDLEADPELRWEVGMRNRREIERSWTWEKRAEAYRRFLEAAMR